jgi:phosphoglycerate dehydrogenase-like enzyme
LHEQFSALATGIGSFTVRDLESLRNRIGEADVLVISGLWRNELLNRAPRLCFIQSIGAGTDQFPTAALAQRAIRLASARGVNARAVAEHAMALILALSRRLPEARDNQKRCHWRAMIGDIERREDEVGGKTLVVVGLGGIGDRLARLAKAFASGGRHVVPVSAGTTSLRGRAGRGFVAPLARSSPARPSRRPRAAARKPSRQ